MENEDYKFRNELTKECLPYGVSHLSEVKREEISGILKTIDDKAKKSDWIRMFVISRIDCEDGWNEDSILIRLKQIRADINALKGKLKE